MRPIKFRAWDKVNKVMHTLEGVYAYEGEVSGIILADMQTVLYYNDSGLNPDLELMQYTGLTDKNGKEIYEGDIISEAGAYVVWSERLACWAFNFKDSDTTEVPLYYERTAKTYDHFEVIGNIYENPELLNG